MDDDNPSPLHVSCEGYRLSSEMVFVEVIFPFRGYYKALLFCGMLNVFAIPLSWHTCGEALAGALNSMLFSHTELALRTPDSDESGATASRRIGSIDKNDRG